VPISFSCGQCNAKLNVSTRNGGKSMSCPKCGNALVVPFSLSDDSDVSAPELKRTDAAKANEHGSASTEAEPSQEEYRSKRPARERNQRDVTDRRSRRDERSGSDVEPRNELTDRPAFAFPEWYVYACLVVGMVGLFFPAVHVYLRPAMAVTAVDHYFTDEPIASQSVMQAIFGTSTLHPHFRNMAEQEREFANQNNTERPAEPQPQSSRWPLLVLALVPICLAIALYENRRSAASIQNEMSTRKLCVVSILVLIFHASSSFSVFGSIPELRLACRTEITIWFYLVIFSILLSFLPYVVNVWRSASQPHVSSQREARGR